MVLKPGFDHIDSIQSLQASSPQHKDVNTDSSYITVNNTRNVNILSKNGIGYQRNSLQFSVKRSVVVIANKATAT